MVQNETSGSCLNAFARYSIIWQMKCMDLYLEMFTREWRYLSSSTSW
ncbi:hypothetical protein HanPI659440_Chr17g0697911 [Helianthus annuus]|nr:hypothetical protein HanPI659440_Chr17g0697911 [Helianthus annuus]